MYPSASDSSSHTLHRPYKKTTDMATKKNQSWRKTIKMYKDKDTGKSVPIAEE